MPRKARRIRIDHGISTQPSAMLGGRFRRLLPGYVPRRVVSGLRGVFELRGSVRMFRIFAAHRSTAFGGR